MHRSRLAGFIIDSKTTDLEGAAAFWSSALGLPRGGSGGPSYEGIDAGSRDLAVEVQRVDHDSRVHLDIESTDVDAEAARLEALGAKRVSKIQTWWVMEAPTGHRFCVIRAKNVESKTGWSEWP
jgi:hypothetical protein